jgi:hypothetical protein
LRNEERHDRDQRRKTQPDQVTAQTLGNFAAIRLLIAWRGVVGVQMEAVHGVAHWAAPIR